MEPFEKCGSFGLSGQGLVTGIPPRLSEKGMGELNIYVIHLPISDYTQKAVTFIVNLDVGQLSDVWVLINFCSFLLLY